MHILKIKTKHLDLSDNIYVTEKNTLFGVVVISEQLQIRNSQNLMRFQHFFKKKMGCMSAI